MTSINSSRKCPWPRAPDPPRESISYQLYLVGFVLLLMCFQPDFLTPVSVLPTPLNTERSSLSYLLDISDTWMDEIIGWQVTYMGTFDGTMHMVSAQLDWDISDQWQVNLDWLRMYADNNSLYSALSGRENVALELTYQY